MHVIEVIYIAAAIVALSAGAPQLRQLLITKASDELSLPTWCIWFVTQFVTLLYVSSIGNTLMVVVNIAWVSFYGAMVTLILHYRRRPRAAEVVAIEDEYEPGI